MILYNREKIATETEEKENYSSYNEMISFNFISKLKFIEFNATQELLY